ncbi:MAG: DUF4199 domain-containing protein [Winogradskyella sp.]|uniref:DUF4199 domain-containing protein n=1 Tax=Winogradskyella sp. TaxID=1883156 RepID=UPI0018465EB3|nr:DUF4199 domain-containing protein [Winogradskyella sp.]MBT8246082.1 DUF4199 domain-containing protein [Winogradskyella sp.]NNK23014.1 DUF4199 domain-containing protein [Winogradskyella sp.]
MKRTIIKFGGYSCLLLIAVFGISFLFEDQMDFSTSEIFGYATIVLSLSFVFFGIKNYRDKENNGIISFGKVLKIGLLITLLASLTFGLINVIYTEVINPEFSTEYYNYSVEKIKKELPTEEYKAKIEELESQQDLFRNPLFNFVVMSLTVFIIGFIISLISGLILQRKK